jgi:hypothetical protein
MDEIKKKNDQMENTLNKIWFKGKEVNFTLQYIIAKDKNKWNPNVCYIIIDYNTKIAKYLSKDGKWYEYQWEWVEGKDKDEKNSNWLRVTEEEAINWNP